MSLPLRPTESADTMRVSSTARQPCRECKRRKGKCDGKVPVCSVCQRYNRHCLYDKHSRSSLTRKHLTEVEERLEQAEALLKTFFTDAELSQMLAHGVSSRADVNPRATGGLPTIPDKSLTSQQGHLSSSLEPSSSVPQNLFSDAFPSQQYWAEASSVSGTDQEQRSNVGLFDPLSVSTPDASENAPLPLESLPSADDDFEWDERESSWTAADGGGGSSIVNSVEGDVPKITDGMATLTADDSNAGYLGTVSGAALLRLIWMSTTTSEGTAGDKPDAQIERRKSLEQFISHRPNDNPTPSHWLRTQPLLTRVVVDTLIDAYFALYHPNFPILHEPYFREQYAKLNGRPGGSTWHVLANIVVALGSFVSSTCSDDTDTTVFAAVKGQLSIGCLETGNLALVQAFAMAANYLQKRNRPNSGYNYGGVALRLAISLGLHKEFHGWQTSPLKKEIRRRVWWSLCVLDVGATVTYGRPLNWPQVGVETAFPLNIHERDLTSTSTSLPPELEEPTTYTYIRTQSSYHLSTMRIYNRLISSPFPSASELLSLDDELIEGWRSTLPHYFCDRDLQMSPEYLLGHSISRWRFRNLRIIMYRPFLIRWAQNDFSSSTSQASPQGHDQFSNAEAMATERCFAAAKESIDVLMSFWTSATHTRLAAWYVLYFLLQASLIPIHCLHRSPSHPFASSWRTQVQTTLAIINAMTDINPSAPKCRDVINRLCGKSLYDVNIPSSAAQFGVSVESPSATDWMAEIDTAIDGYDIYCDRLGNAAAAGAEMGGGGGEWNAPPALGVGNGVEDWDWGLML